MGLALLEDILLPVLVYLWRDERSLYLRRQSELWKFGEDQLDNCIMYLISLQQSHLPARTASYRSELKQQTGIHGKILFWRNHNVTVCISLNLYDISGRK